MDFKLNHLAQKIINTGLSPNELEVGGELEEYSNGISCSDGFWYGLTDGGYFKVEEIIDDENQVKEIKKAIELLREFEKIWEQISLEF